MTKEHISSLLCCQAHNQARSHLMIRFLASHMWDCCSRNKLIAIQCNIVRSPSSSLPVLHPIIAPELASLHANIANSKEYWRLGTLIDSTVTTGSHIGLDVTWAARIAENARLVSSEDFSVGDQGKLGHLSQIRMIVRVHDPMQQLMNRDVTLIPDTNSIAHGWVPLFFPCPVLNSGLKQ